jgi:protoporphyrinogen oxidase
VYERMASMIKDRGGRILLNTPVKRVVAEGKEIIGVELNDGVEEYDHVISTMPLSQLVTRLPGIPENVKQLAGKLRFRNTILVYLNIEGENLFPDNWLYIHAPSLDTGRITNFRNWVPEINGNSNTSILALEYWCYSEDARWQASDEELIELAKKEIRQTKLIGDHQILAGYVYRIPKCYPVYYSGYKKDLNPIVQSLQEYKNLSVIGRYGSFKYNNQDHSILMGLLCAENIVYNRHHNLWDINTDYETYQESSSISNSGLVKEPSEAIVMQEREQEQKTRDRSKQKD